MTVELPHSEDKIHRAIRRVAAGLPPRLSRANVYLEDRVDRRVSLASSGHQADVTTRTRGLSITGTSSTHRSDPDEVEFDEGAFAENWVAEAVAAVAASGVAASVGRRHPSWSARLVSFQHHVWVGLPNGAVLFDARSGCRLELRAEVDRGPKSYGIQELVLRSPSGAPILEAFTRAFDRAETRAAIASVPPRGLSCAVFAPGVCGIVAHELIGHALEGDVVVRGPTWITQAESLASVRPLTVLDDPRRGRGAWTIDDEGVEARETILVEDGRQVGLLLDRASANALGKLPTGHGRRASYLDAVRARMGCTVIMSGSDDPTEILRSTRSGVYVRRLVGGDTDPRSGRASFLVSDSDRIDGGRIAEPFGPFILELDGQTSWSSIDRVGDDFELDTCIGTCIREGQPIVVSVGAPTIRIGVVTVSS